MFIIGLVVIFSNDTSNYNRNNNNINRNDNNNNSNDDIIYIMEYFMKHHWFTTIL